MVSQPETPVWMLQYIISVSRQTECTSNQMTEDHCGLCQELTMPAAPKQEALT